jgi:diguanylate cyclase (GGDEF)-like protein
LSAPSSQGTPAAAPESGDPSPLERALQSLIGVLTPRTVERRLVGGMSAVAGGAWVALFEPTGRGLHCRRTHRGGPAAGSTHPVASPLDGAVGAVAVYPFAVGEEREGLLAVGPGPSGAHPPEVLQALSRLSEAGSTAARGAARVEQLRAQVLFDFLTGCRNRRGFEEQLRLEFVRASRYRRRLALLMLDLDGFKAINDELGHAVGDHVLRRVGELLVTSFRSTDFACRYGGDEFAVIFPETARAESLRLAERLRRRIERLFPDEVVPRRVTASLGVAAYPTDAEDVEGLLAATDRALYRAKFGGRNRVAAP